MGLLAIIVKLESVSAERLPAGAPVRRQVPWVTSAWEPLSIP